MPVITAEAITLKTVKSARRRSWPTMTSYLVTPPFWRRKQKQPD
jgi:hypothetical protein